MAQITIQWLLWAGFFCCLLVEVAQRGVSNCRKANAQSCAACIQAGPNCGWCKNAAFLQDGEWISARCDDLEALTEKGCPPEGIENPGSSQKIVKNRVITNHAKGAAETEPEDVVQIQPQQVQVKLRIGEPQIVSLKVKRLKPPPLDVYYLVDLSQSMKDDLENAKNLGISLLDQVKNLSSDFQIGLGTFVEEVGVPPLASPRKPCTGNLNCTSVVRYRNVLNLTSDGSLFNKLIGEQQIYDNVDSPESGLQVIAIMAVCGPKIGWRNVPRLLVFSTDATFHMVRDGELGGIFLPDDVQCRLEDYTRYTLHSQYYDYSAIVQLAQTLHDKNIQFIFAVTQELQPAYEVLKNSIPTFRVGTLSSNSSDVIQQIMDLYNAMSSEVILESSPPPKEVTIEYRSFCKDGVSRTGEEGRKCSNISIEDEVRFEIQLTANRCPEKEPIEAVKIQPLGFTEEAEINLQVLCECACSNEEVPQSPLCGLGTLECGVCRCEPGRFGKQCECTLDDVHSEDTLSTCRPENSTEICSHNGECICGACACHARENPDEVYSGKFCQCDNFNCKQADGLLCGGRGDCLCGKCVCLPGYTGAACECSLDTNPCLASNGQICNGQGVCECEVCNCTNAKFQGPTCQICPTCLGTCAEHKACVQCRAFGNGEKKETCLEQCTYFNMTLVEHVIELLHSGQSHGLTYCSEKDEKGCLFFFSYTFDSDYQAVVHVVKTPICLRWDMHDAEDKGLPLLLQSSGITHHSQSARLVLALFPWLVVWGLEWFLEDLLYR